VFGKKNIVGTNPYDASVQGQGRCYETGDSGRSGIEQGPNRVHAIAIETRLTCFVCFETNQLQGLARKQEIIKQIELDDLKLPMLEDGENEFDFSPLGARPKTQAEADAVEQAYVNKVHCDCFFCLI